MTRRLAVLTTFVALFALPAVASADTTLTMNGPAAKSLKKKGVKIYEQLPARGIGSKTELPTAGGTIASKATIDHNGALRFKRGKKILTLGGVRVVIGSGSQTVSALNGKKRVTLYSIKNGKSKPSVNQTAQTAKLSGATLRFTKAGAKLLRKKLGKKPSTKRSAGTIKVNAALTVEPKGFVRPATAIDISSSTITWHIKESFVQYINTGDKPGDGITTSGGATAGAPAGDTLIYDYTFPTRGGGWYDPVSHTALVLGQGTLRFKYTDHGIDFTTSDPELELNGSASRGIFRFQDGKRDVLFNLAATNPSSPFASGNIAATVPPGSGSSVFGGFYAPGESLGYVQVSFTT